MALPKIYSDGTASVANGSTAVTGNGTAWSGNIVAGDYFRAEGLAVRIASVESNTGLTLVAPWPGTALSGSAYEISFTPDVVALTGATRELRLLLGDGGVPLISTNNGSDFENPAAVLGNLQFLQAGAGAIARSAESRLRETIYLSDFGAVGDGITDDTVGVSAAIATGRPLHLSEGTYATTLALTDVTSPLRGRGQIELGTGNKLPPNYNYIDAAPASRGDHQSFSTAFNGDLSNSLIQAGFYVSGAATLGQPATGFEHNEELSPIYIYMRNVDGGHNEQTSGNDGRTTWIASRIRGHHSGQGGMMGYSTSIFANGTKAGATTFLASPAAAGFNAETYAGADGVYLNPFEVNCQDQGWDAAAIGGVFNMTRTNTTGALEAFWAGIRVQSVGTEPINSGFMVTGKVDTAIDITKAVITSPAMAAMALPADSRIYFEASSANNWHKTANGDTWLSYNSANLALETWVNGVNVFSAKSNEVLVNDVSLSLETGNLRLLNAAAIVAIGGNKVLAARQAAIANAAAGTEVATINSILSTMRTHGFIAT